jgi:hypothetical protein
MKQEQKFDPMNEFLRIFLEGLRKQGFGVMLSLSAASLFWWQAETERYDCKKEVSELKASMMGEVARLHNELDDCEERYREMQTTVLLLQYGQKPIFKQKK